MKTNTIQSNNSSQKGFVLLFTLVVSAIIFFVGAGIFALSYKELLVSSISQESQKAIFAADAGVECALFADTQFRSFKSDGSIEPFNCFEKQINPSFPGEYDFWMPFDNSTCARVHVRVDSPQEGQTTVISQGYNKCNDTGEPLLNYPGITERVYKVTF